MPELLEVNGIILSSSPYGEYDRRVMLLTHELGKISAFAHGARRPNSVLSACTRTFAFGKFTLYPGRDAYTIQKAEIKNYFTELSSDVNLTLYAGYFGELVSLFTHENQPAGEELTLLYYSLKALLKDSIQNELVKVCFELRLITVFGTAPWFHECHKCRKKAESGVMNPKKLIFLCTDCEKEEGGIFIPKGALMALSFIQGAVLNRLYTFSVNTETLEIMKKCVKAIVNDNIERPLKSRELLDMMIQGE